jgi:hypothetical protein
MVHEGEDTASKDCMLNNMTTSFNAPGKGDEGVDLTRVKALEYIIKKSIDRSLSTKTSLGNWTIPKTNELFYKEGNNAMVMHSQFKNVFVRWDVEFMSLRCISGWNTNVETIN